MKIPPAAPYDEWGCHTFDLRSNRSPRPVTRSRQRMSRDPTRERRTVERVECRPATGQEHDLRLPRDGSVVYGVDSTILDRNASKRRRLRAVLIVERLLRLGDAVARRSASRSPNDATRLRPIRRRQHQCRAETAVTSSAPHVHEFPPSPNWGILILARTIYCHAFRCRVPRECHANQHIRCCGVASGLLATAWVRASGEVPGSNRG